MMDARLRTPRRRCFSFASATVLVAAAAGCRTTEPRDVGPGSRHDRFMEAYPELSSGRFLIIADFEDPKQMELFRLTGASGGAKCVLNHNRGRRETGRSCLQFTARSPADTILINNSAAANWYLKRNWHPYDLLILSVRSPKLQLTAELTIASGPAEERLTAHTSVRLKPGWNTLRLDLAGLGEHIALDDIQELRLAVSGAPRPVDLFLDDILLTSDRADLLGDSTNRDAGLYVQRVGRRWKIGAGHAGADFELTFANGQIIEWYNLAADPDRLRNLVRGTALGPSRMAASPSDMGKGDIDRLGKNVSVSSQIVEMTAVRTVVTSEWRFVDDGAPERGSGDRADHRWVYSIYPTGQIYVAVETAPETPSRPASQPGLAVSFASVPEDEFQRYVRASSEPGAKGNLPALATARSRPRDTVLLYVPDHGRHRIRMAEHPRKRGDTPALESQTTFIATVDQQGATPREWACHILLGSADRISHEETLARAADYFEPDPPRIELGSLVGVGGVRADAGGFDPTAGCHVIAPEDETVRFHIGGGDRPRYSPAFKVLNPRNWEAWVYVDHVLFDHVARDPQGNLILQLWDTVRKPTLVEVLFRRPGDTQAP